MIFTLKFKVLVVVILALAILGAIVANQYILQKEVDAQIKYDNSVQKANVNIWHQVQKVASEEASLLPTATPTPVLIVRHKTLTK